MSVRHGAWVLPRVVNKEPQDAHVNKRWKTWIPECLQKVLLKNACMSLLDYRGLGLLSTRHPYNSSVMINDTLPMKVMSGAVKVKGQIQRFDGSTVVFDDGSRAEDVDCVIFATGFQFEATFIDNSIIADDLGKLELFMHVLPPRLKHRTLTVIGFVECRGGTGPMAELQARWSTQLFKGNIVLPSLENMLADIQTTRDEGYKRYQLFRPRASTVEYQDMLAKSMNALPSFLDLVFRDPVLALHHYFGPALPQSYRLVGPHAQKNARERVIESARRLMHGITLSTVRRLADPKCKSANSRGGEEWNCRVNVDDGLLDSPHLDPAGDPRGLHILHGATL
ncbi:dimethylaniline monooxygenase [N-oxide-forming] 2-like [Diadema antillarum]|uniref:dimethylaniline monooxygenase [N-oxide-forming] 2-like n=1 Tax=Diadema antillarum TaxID=105358 RepID=UPI003A877A9B